MWSCSHECQKQVSIIIHLSFTLTSPDFRTAELLAVKLAQLRGDSVKSVMASQALNISVTHPQKVKYWPLIGPGGHVTSDQDAVSDSLTFKVRKVRRSFAPGWSGSLQFHHVPGVHLHWPGQDGQE